MVHGRFNICSIIALVFCLDFGDPSSLRAFVLLEVVWLDAWTGFFLVADVGGAYL